mgnify:CR=1 FL=1
MAPVVHACARRNDEIDATVCLTGQHREMLAQVTDYFAIEGNLDLELMQPNQTLAALTGRCLNGIDQAVEQYTPDCIVAQGDTTTVMAAAMAAFYRRTPFVHVEAGLRTGNLYAPWPEEFNHRVASIVTTLHCAPTEQAAENLRAEQVPDAQIHVTGNTVIDALLWAVERERKSDAKWRARHAYLGDRRRSAEAEFGVSTLDSARGRGLGARLFDHAALHARNRGVARLVIHALAENAAMLRLARRAGAAVERHGAEAEAVLKLPPISLSDRLRTLLDEQAAELDYGLKRQAFRFNR